MHLGLAHNKPEATYVKFHENVCSQKIFSPLKNAWSAFIKFINFEECFKKVYISGRQFIHGK